MTDNERTKGVAIEEAKGRVESKARECCTVLDVLSMMQGTVIQDYYVSKDGSRRFSSINPAMQDATYTIVDEDRGLAVQIEPTARVLFARAELDRPDQGAIHFVLIDPPLPDAPNAERL